MDEQDTKDWQAGWENGYDDADFIGGVHLDKKPYDRNPAKLNINFASGYLCGYLNSIDDQRS